MSKILTKRYFDFHTKYLISITVLIAKTAREGKNYSSYWPVSNLLDGKSVIKIF
jgi:hypothetical protein